MASQQQTLAPYYITTAIDYVNAAPHLGHAYEKIATDVMARFQRLMGKPVFFLTGTDEHGIKIEKNAKAHGLMPQAFVDSLSQQFKDTWSLCQLSYDRFIRTTEAEHYQVVTLLWKRLQEKGDIYKAAYEGKYCSGCEAFLNERDLTEEGLCAIHLSKPEAVMEENYFFRLTAYKEVLLKHIEANPHFILPAFRKTEVLKMLEDVVDISISRSRQVVSWGIPVPGDEEQLIYVWIDALSNYLTGIGYLNNEALFQQFWQNPHSDVVHVIGKDILRFHAIYWPAMLLAADLPLPKTIMAHGFITLNEAKISKSLGNVVAPQDLMSHYELPNSDAVRYYLMTVVPFGQDGNFSMEEFKLRVNADLANNLGNLLNRSLAMLAKYCGGVVPDLSPVQLDLFPETLPPEAWVEGVVQHYQQFSFQKAAELILSRVDEANVLINNEEPWNLFKNGDIARLQALLYSVLERLRQVAILLAPITPSLAEGLLAQLGFLPNSYTPLRLYDALAWVLPYGQVTQPAGPLLPRLDSELAGSAKKA